MKEKKHVTKATLLLFEIELRKILMENGVVIFVLLYINFYDARKKREFIIEIYFLKEKKNEKQFIGQS